MDNWSFVVVSDMQPGSPKSYRFNPAWLENWRTARQQILDLVPQPEFLLIAGDLTRDGTIHRWELETMRDDLDAMRIPWHAVPGNMDIGNKHTDRQGPDPDRDDVSLNMTSDALGQFESLFGPSRWSFAHRNARVSGFCDILLGSGLPEEAALWEWLDAQTAKPRSRFHVWLMHYALFADRPDEPQWDIADPEQYFQWYFCVDQSSRDRLMEVFKATGATRVVSGHIHRRRHVTAEGIHFDFAPATSKAQWAGHWPDGDGTLGFLQYHVGEEEMTCEFVPLERVSTRTDGYGPGGHPRPEARDYSLAREPLDTSEASSN